MAGLLCANLCSSAASAGRHCTPSVTCRHTERSGSETLQPLSGCRSAHQRSSGASLRRIWHSYSPTAYCLTIYITSPPACRCAAHSSSADRQHSLHRPPGCARQPQHQLRSSQALPSRQRHRQGCESCRVVRQAGLGTEQRRAGRVRRLHGPAAAGRGRGEAHHLRICGGRVGHHQQGSWRVCQER